MQNPVAEVKQELFIPSIAKLRAYPFRRLEGDHKITEKRDLRLRKKFSFHLRKGEDIRRLVDSEKPVVKPSNLGITHQTQGKARPFPAERHENLLSPPA